MQIFIKNVTGDSKHPLFSNPEIPNANAFVTAYTMNVPTNLSIANLTTLLSLRTSLPESSLRLVYAGKHLSSSPSSTLSDHHIQRESTIHLALPLRGGMPPKKIRCTFKECKEAAQRIIGECGFCNGNFCGKHRLLEDHKCTGLEDVSSSSTFPESDVAAVECGRLEPRWWLIGLDQELLANMM